MTYDNLTKEQATNAASPKRLMLLAGKACTPTVSNLLKLFNAPF